MKMIIHHVCEVWMGLDERTQAKVEHEMQWWCRDVEPKAFTRQRQIKRVIFHMPKSDGVVNGGVTRQNIFIF